MSPNTQRTHTSGTPTHTRRRRHAAPGDPTWVRRAGLVGGVVSAFAFCGAAAPALADNTHSSADESGPANTASAAGSSSSGSSGAPGEVALLSTRAAGERAVAAIDREAIAAALAADKEQAAADAKKAATATWEAHRRAEAKAKAKAARERAAREAAARSAARAALGSASPTASASAAPTATATVAPASSSKVDQLIAFLKSQLGKPYVYGATGPDSYDCSGLTQAAFASIGVDIPRTSQEQSTVGTPVAISALQAGDLIFWGGEGSAFHVGVYIGGGQYLDAANPSTPVAIHQLADYMPDWAVNVL